MNKQVNETIDGSIKNIIQLKTLDNSLEYAQMFDALNDCPSDFQNKLIAALNSLGQTMNVSPVDAFNKVLCKSDDKDESNVKTKLYNWWGNVFDVLSRCDIPKEAKSEYDTKVDELMSEIMKSASSDLTSMSEEEDAAVNESYENADKSDEDDMMRDMKFAISKLGEVANKVQALLNFVNPYCSNKMLESSIAQMKKWYLKGVVTRSDVQCELGDLYTHEELMDLLDEWDRESDSMMYDPETYDSETEQEDFCEETEMNNKYDEHRLNELENEEVEVTYYFPDEMKEPGDKSFYPMKTKLKDISTWYIGRFERVRVNVDGESVMVYRVSSPGDYDYFKFDNRSDEDKFLEYSEILNTIETRKDKRVSDQYDELYKEDNVMMNKTKCEASNMDELVERRIYRGYVLGYTSTHDAYEQLMDAFGDRVYADDQLSNWFGTATDFDRLIKDIKTGKKTIEDLRMFIEDENLSDSEKSVDTLVEMISDDEGLNDNEEFDKSSDSEFKVGDKVIWDDPDGDVTNGWTITDINGEVITINNKDGSEAETFEGELTHDSDYEEIDEAHKVAGDNEWVTLDSLVGESTGSLERLAHKYQKKIGEALGVLKNFRDESLEYAPTCEHELGSAIENLESVKEWIDIGVEEGFDGVDYEDVTDESTEEKNSDSDEIKNSEPKKYKNDDGKTQTLITGSKQVMNEMTIEKEVNSVDELRELLWGQAIQNLDELTSSGLVSDDVILNYFDEFEMKNITAINDLLAYDFAEFLNGIGVNGELWYQDGELEMAE